MFLSTTNLRVWAVRGAVSIENANSDHMIERVGELLKELQRRNKFSCETIISIQFTQTSDIDFLNAASAARKGSFSTCASQIPLFCALEPPVPNGAPQIIRVLLSYYHSLDHSPQPVYLYRAQSLREDIRQNSSRLE